MIYKIRVTGEVLETATATRRCTVEGQVLTFGREPVYLECNELPAELATDPYLRIETVESAPAGSDVIDLKSERVQDPAAAAFPDAESHLKSERVQDPAVAVPDAESNLKSERVQEPAVLPAPPDTESNSKSEPEPAVVAVAQEPVRKRR